METRKQEIINAFRNNYFSVKTTLETMAQTITMLETNLESNIDILLMKLDIGANKAEGTYTFTFPNTHMIEVTLVSGEKKYINKIISNSHSVLLGVYGGKTVAWSKISTTSKTQVYGTFLYYLKKMFA